MAPRLRSARNATLRALDRMSLLAPVYRAYERMRAVRASEHWEDAADLPVPPPRLRVEVAGTPEVEWFLESGRRQAEIVRSAADRNGAPLESAGRMLDFGCGCGRVLRHWHELDRTRVHGCDIDPRMVAWCAENLPFAQVTVNALSPPLPYEDSSFGLVHAFSVMTHLSEELQHAWLKELRRILRPGGYFLFSTLGEYYASRNRLSAAERDAFANGDLVVLYERSAGTSLCSAYHPPEYVRHTLARDLEHVTFRASADDGRHDIHLLRKPS